MDSFCKHIFPLINMSKTIRPGADLVGVCRGAHRPPPPSLPEMTYAFLIQLVFCKIWRYVWYVFSAVHIILLGTLNNGDNNVKKKNWFYEQNNCSARALRFLVNFFDVHCTTTTWKPTNATSNGGRGNTTTNFPFSIWTWTKPLRIQLQETEVAYIWIIERFQIDAIKFDSFFSDVFTAVVVVVA